MINIYIYFPVLHSPDHRAAEDGKEVNSLIKRVNCFLQDISHCHLGSREKWPWTLITNNRWSDTERHGRSAEETVLFGQGSGVSGLFWGRNRATFPLLSCFLSWSQSQVSGDTDNKTWDVGQESPFIGPNKSDLCEGSVVSVGEDSRRLESPLMEIWWVKLFYFIGKSGTLRLRCVFTVDGCFGLVRFQWF